MKTLSKGKQAETQAANATVRDQLALMLDILGIMPHGVQVSVVSDNYTVWASLSEKYMVTSASDLMLKHGMAISGKWKIVGILDAVPDELAEPSNVAIPGGPAVELLASLYPIARTMFGRPPHAFGMTPILIYREIVR